VARAVAEFEGPVLLIHGAKDEVIPYPHAERIAEVRDRLEVITLDCGHNDCAPYWGEIREQIVRFMQISVPLA
jgi:pimeloyl-ACP methyl ester carboxylesterase